jgi:hypothetical protein
VALSEGASSSAPAYIDHSSGMRALPERQLLVAPMPEVTMEFVIAARRLV